MISLKRKKLYIEFHVLLTSILLLSFIEVGTNLPSLGFLLGFAVLFRHFKINIIWFLFFVFVFIINSVIVLLGPCGDFFLRSTASLGIMLWFCLALNNFTKNISVALYEAPTTEPTIILKILLLCNALFIFFDAVYMNTTRPSGLFFSEPSHANFLLVPLTLFFILQRNVFFSVLGICVFLVSYSSSGLFLLLAVNSVFIVFIFSRIFIYFRIERFQIIIICIGFALVVLLATSAETLVRLEGVINSVSVSESTNLSSLVYINGWLVAFEYLKQTNMLGVGLNLMGCEGGVQTQLSPMITRISGAYLNYNDGSFLISKLISEVGVFVVPLIIIFLRGIYLALKLIMDDLLKNKPASSIDAFASIFYLSGVILLFIRGAGYYSIPFLYVLLSLSILINGQKPKGMF